MKKTLLLLTLCLGLTSCFEDGYDLTNDIDMTLKFGNDDSSLSMPISFSKDILLKEVIKETAVVKHLKGDDGKEFIALKIENMADESGTRGVTINLASPGGAIEIHDISQQESDLGEMPEFLEDPEVVLDVENPVLLLDINNESPADLKSTITLTPLDKDKKEILDEGGNPVKMTITDLVISNGNQYIALSEIKGKFPLEQTYDWRYQDGIRKIIRKIPRYIRIDVDKLSTDYEYPFFSKNLTVNFGIYIPLKFQKDLKIIYNYNESSVTDMLKNFEDVDVKTMTFNGMVESTLPLDLHLDLVPVNAKDEPVKDLKVEGKCDFKPLETDRSLSLKLTPINGTKLNDHFGKSDDDRVIKALKLRAVAAAGNNDPSLIYTDTYIKINKARLTMDGGITVDAN